MKQNNILELHDLGKETFTICKNNKDGTCNVLLELPAEMEEQAKYFIDELTTLIDKVREEDWTTIHRAIIDALFSVNKRYSKDDVGLEGYGYNKGINKAISKLNQLLDLSEQYLQSIKEQEK